MEQNKHINNDLVCVNAIDNYFFMYIINITKLVTELRNIFTRKASKQTENTS